jgi:hypothetical protein
MSLGGSAYEGAWNSCLSLLNSYWWIGKLAASGLDSEGGADLMLFAISGLMLQ